MGAGQDAITYAALGVSILILIFIYRRSNGVGILFYIAAFFAFFAFGPVINYLAGNTIYFGTPVAYIDNAAVGFAVALAGLAAADLLAKRREARAPTNVDADFIYPFFPFVFLPLIGYGLVMGATLLPMQLAGATKTATLAAAGGFHYSYILIQLAAVSTYFIARRVKFIRNLWAVNLLVYVGYCLVTAERDFLFVLFSILIYRQVLVGKKRLSPRLIVAGVGAVLAASLLFAQRAGGRLDITGILNQGSLLFVDSYVMRWLDRWGEYRFGGTYAESLINATPLYDSGTTSLSAWLARDYAPGGGSAYGFSLSAEAYLNFGYVGIFVAFLVLGCFQRVLSDRFGRSDWWSYFAVYATTAILYALRGDSAQLFGALFYGTIFFIALRLVSMRKEPLPLARKAT